MSYSSHDTEREVVFTLQDLSNLVDTQGVEQVMQSIRLMFPTMFHELSKYFVQQEKIKKVGRLQC